MLFSDIAPAAHDSILAEFQKSVFSQPYLILHVMSASLLQIPLEQKFFDLSPGANAIVLAAT